MEAKIGCTNFVTTYDTTILERLITENLARHVLWLSVTVIFDFPIGSLQGISRGKVYFLLLSTSKADSFSGKAKELSDYVIDNESVLLYDLTKLPTKVTIQLPTPDPGDEYPSQEYKLAVVFKKVTKAADVADNSEIASISTYFTFVGICHKPKE